MNELCGLMNALYPVKNTRKPSKPRKSHIKVGATVKFWDKTGVVTRKCDKVKGAWFVAFDGVEIPYSISSDMIHLVAA